VHGIGWETQFYDASIIDTTTIITAVTKQSAPDKGLPTWFDLRRATSIDVDRFAAWSPIAEQLVQGAVKPALRSNWLVVRDGADAAVRTEDSLLNERLLLDGCDTSWLQQCPLGPLGAFVPQGLLDPAHGLTGNPESLREPNTGTDIEPGAVFQAYPPGTTPGLQPGEEATLGYLNSYAGYTTAYHAFLDVTAAHATLYTMTWKVGGSCVLCTTGPAQGEPDILGQGALTPPGDTSQVLQPGTFLFNGPLMGWRPRAAPPRGGARPRGPDRPAPGLRLHRAGGRLAGRRREHDGHVPRPRLRA